MSDHDKAKRTARTKAGKPGAKPETLRIEGNWRDAVRTALAKGKPPAPEKASKKKGAAKKKRRPK